MIAGLIPGLSTIRLIVGGVVLAIVLGAGFYVRHKFKVAERVPVLEQALADYAAMIERERVQAQERIENERALQKKLTAATAGNAELLRGLRAAYRKALPPLASAGTEPPGTSGIGSSTSESDNLDRAVTEAISAAKRDSIRLQEWIRYYESIPCELKLDGCK